MRGLSITLCFGSYGGFYIKFTRQSWRICLAYVAFTIYFSDLEDFISYMRREKNVAFQLGYKRGIRASSLTAEEKVECLDIIKEYMHDNPVQK